VTRIGPRTVAGGFSHGVFTPSFFTLSARRDLLLYIAIRLGFTAGGSLA